MTSLETNQPQCKGCSAKVDEKSSDIGEWWDYCNKCYFEDQSDSEEEEKGDWCYGTGHECFSKSYIMAGGGAHWWNYVVEFDVNTGEQKGVYIESKDGKEKQDKSLYVDDEGNRLYLGYERPDDDWTLLEHVC